MAHSQHLIRCSCTKRRAALTLRSLIFVGTAADSTDDTKRCIFNATKYSRKAGFQTMSNPNLEPLLVGVEVKAPLLCMHASQRQHPPPTLLASPAFCSLAFLKQIVGIISCLLSFQSDEAVGRFSRVRRPSLIHSHKLWNRRRNRTSVR